LVGGVGEIRKGCAANHRARRRVRDPKHQISAALVGDGDAVCRELLAVETVLCLLELQILVFGGCLPPKVNLCRSRIHATLNGFLADFAGQQHVAGGGCSQVDFA
jgi:hypothetical protein